MRYIARLPDCRTAAVLPYGGTPQAERDDHTYIRTFVPSFHLEGWPRKPAITPMYIAARKKKTLLCEACGQSFSAQSCVFALPHVHAHSRASLVSPWNKYKFVRDIFRNNSLHTYTSHFCWIIFLVESPAAVVLLLLYFLCV